MKNQTEIKKHFTIHEDSDNPIAVLPEFVKLIDTYLPYMALVKFHAVNKLMYNNKPNYCQLFIDNFDMVCLKMVDIVDGYLEEHKRDVNIYKENWRSDKGFVRALCFNDIFLASELLITTPFKLFALYALLAEKNGKYLKSHTKARIPGGIEIALKNYLFAVYLFNESNFAKAIHQFITLRDAAVVGMSDSDFFEMNLGKRFHSIFKPLQNNLPNVPDFAWEHLHLNSNRTCTIF